jgi:hypothetical protein
MIENHKKILAKLHNIYKEKNEKYGNSFADNIKEWGYIAAGTIISQKFSRLKTLIKQNNLFDNGTDESLQDTLIDLANYCLITAMELEETKKNNNNIKDKTDA